MAIEWTGSGPDVLLRLDRNLTEPLGIQLARELRDAIRAGRLAAHERLPSSRALARSLGLSRGLVLDCYAQLQAEGYLVARGGSATRVAAVDEPHAPPIQRAPRLGVDFRPGVPDLSRFPHRDWLAALRQACRALPTAALGYGDPRGDPVLREVLAAYLRRVRGGATDPARIVVCTGVAQGLNLVLRVLARGGARRVGVENPGDPEQGNAARRAGLEAVPIPVDDDGIDVAALAERKLDAAILTPAHQFPTGGVLSPARRQALVRWAAARGRTIIEDDYDAEFRYDRAPVPALHGLAPDHVVGLGSISKSLAPALRLGWIVCPPRLAAAIADEKYGEDRGAPGIDQRALAALIEAGHYDRHLRRMRAIYTARRAALVDALARLPGRADEATVIAAARARSVGLHGVSRYRTGDAPARCELVIGFGNVAEEAIERGIAAIASVLDPGRPAPG